MLSSRNQRRTRARCILIIETYLSSRDLNNTAQLPAGPYRNLGNVRCSDFWHGKHPPRCRYLPPGAVLTARIAARTNSFAPIIISKMSSLLCVQVVSDVSHPALALSIPAWLGYLHYIVTFVDIFIQKNLRNVAYITDRSCGRPR